MKSTSLRHLNRSKAKQQQGFTILELMVVLLVGLSLFALLAAGYNEYNKSRGRSEGQRISTYQTCGLSNISSPSFVSTTLATLVNLDCFAGAGNQNITGKGTSSASATSPLSNTAYAVAAVNLSGGTNNGLQITTGPIPARTCSGFVKAADQTSARIIVTPTGGTAVTVKADGGNTNDDTLGTACNSADTVSISVAASRS